MVLSGHEVMAGHPGRQRERGWRERGRGVKGKRVEGERERGGGREGGEREGGGREVERQREGEDPVSRSSIQLPG